MQTSEYHTLWAMLAALELDPLAQGLQMIDAQHLLPPPTPTPADPSALAWSEMQQVGPYHAPLLPFPLLPTQPALVVVRQPLSAAIFASLAQRYPAQHPVTLLLGADLDRQSTELQQLAAEPLLPTLQAFFLPPLALLEDRRGPDGLNYVVTRLLGPYGCPWDRQQTHQSLRAGLLSETYEVLEALDQGDMAGLCEELGDLLLQVIFHSELARQAGHWSLADVLQEVTDKLIRRHPHVFGDLTVEDSDGVIRNWEQIKQAERAAKGKTERGPLDGIPAGLPALALAQELSKKAARADFAWPSSASAWAKVDEELAEVHEALALDDSPAHSTRLSEELGDLLFAIAVAARLHGIDAETALRDMTQRFRQRFHRMQQQAAALGGLATLSIETKLALWSQAKE